MLRFGAMFAKRLQPVIAMLLMGVFSLVVLPREIFHDCAVEHAHTEAATSGAVVSADCPVCDQALPVYQGELLVVVSAFHALLGEQVVVLIPQIERVLCEALSSRGPPMC